jgi:hypothetical protein
MGATDGFAAKWFTDPGFGRHIELRWYKGFAHEATAAGDDWCRYGDRILRALPVRKVTITSQHVSVWSSHPRNHAENDGPIRFTVSGHDVVVPAGRGPLVLFQARWPWVDFDLQHVTQHHFDMKFIPTAADDPLARFRGVDLDGSPVPMKYVSVYEWMVAGTLLLRPKDDTMGEPSPDTSPPTEGD